MSVPPLTCSLSVMALLARVCVVVTQPGQKGEVFGTLSNFKQD